ncbi:hypothetical protein PHPALM_30853 [Phytophthora palmivora]|uniref:Reverse transcriptase n=1 Tax=Phytophthora palmivora TaxID=4796 RepID=A0A2P4X440_9STRA|nr:hypothetical protein PHPALM_30853 [Phytophthora palmivora]
MAQNPGPTGSVPLFTPILPPKIESISHESLVRWRKERREYEAKLRARCRVTGENFEAVAESVVDAFNPHLLETFCELQLDITMGDATDDLLTAEIENIISGVKNDSLPDIKELYRRELKLDMTESDVKARYIDYFTLFNKITMENGLVGCFSQTDGAREKCKRLLASLQPIALKKEVKQRVRFTDKGAATNPKLLFDLIVARATEHERQYQRLKSQKTKQTSREGNSTKLAKVKHQSKPWNSKSPRGTDVTDSQTKAKVELKPVPKPTTTSRPPPGPCPKCKSMHWLRCNRGGKNELLQKMRNARDARKAKRARVKRLGELLPTAERRVTLNGVLELPYCPDSGSDYTVMGQSHWQQLLMVDPSVKMEKLDVPVHTQTFGATWVTAEWKAQLQVLIHTVVGPVEPMGLVDVLIVNADDDEFIVGNDLLVTLGIDVDRQLEQLAGHGDDDTSGDPIELEADDMPVNLNEHPPSDDDIFAAVELLIDRAVANGFPLDCIDQLRTIVHAYDVWRLELRADPPADVPPLEIRLQDGARPTKCKPRKYPPHIRKFLHEFNSRLVALGLVYENPDSRWASPVLPVKKSADLMDLRQTTDYRVVNDQTEVMAAVMPILAVVMENARGMEYFGLFDFLKGFWQLPLAELCQEFLSYMTDEKIFTPRRVPQGSSDAAIFFQKTMEMCFASLLYEHLLIWIDDLLLYAADLDTYMAKLAEFFELLNQFGLKLNAKKCSLYQRQVKWCGRILDHQGVRHDPDRISTLRQMPYPTTAGELQQFVCAINWMRESIVDYARQVAPLQKRLDASLATTKRTRRAAAGIELHLTVEERTAFDNVKEMLATSATLDFPDDSATTCLFSDASDTGWALIVTQVANFEPKKPATEQQHRLLHCMSGSFTGSQLHWTVTEKEALPIVIACEKLDYLLLRPKAFRMYCDHRNLIHMFAPHQSIKKHVKGKLLRWSMKLMNFRYVVEHVPGPENVWADMISRWAGHITPPTVVKRLKVARTRQPIAHSSPADAPISPVRLPLRPLDDEHFEWPSLEEISALQSNFTPPIRSERTSDGIFTVDGRIWVPSEATELIQRLCIVVHCGAQGHRGLHAMLTHLRRLFFIDNITKIVTAFVHKCLLCLHSRGGKIIPRPWGETIDCSMRNGLLHFDYLYMGNSYGNSKYLLVLKDHATHYCDLIVADTPDSRVAVEALLDWHARFGLPPEWVSDCGSHFKNEIVAELARRLRTQQRFTPAYSPWINGSVERVNRDVLQVVRVMILEYKISYKDWVYLVPMIQANLNHTAVLSLGNRAPVELFTGLKCPTPLREFYLPDRNELLTVPESDRIDRYLAELRNSIQMMHKAVDDQKLKQRLLNKKRERGENLVNFTEGDFVLRSRVDEKHKNKLQVTWIGPYRVVRADAHSFRVQHLITGEEHDVHASRLKFYADSNLNVTEELLEHVAAQGILLAVDKLKAHRWNAEIRDFEVLVAWKGFENIEDSYEPMEGLAVDIRVLLDSYVTQAGDPQLTKHWQQLGRSRDQQVKTVMSDLPTASEPRVPPGGAGKARRRSSGRKRRRNAVQGAAIGAAQQGEDIENEETGASSPGAPQRRRTRDENNWPLGRRTRSVTAAVNTSSALNTMRARGVPSGQQHQPRRSRRQRKQRGTAVK